MDSTGINAIRDLAVAASEKNRIDPERDTALVLDGTQKVTNLENLRRKRDRFRGTMATHSIADFIGYTKEEAEDRGPIGMPPEGWPKPVGFVDADSFVATMFYNLGSRSNPGHGDDIAVLSLKQTAPYKAALAVNSQKLDQLTLVHYLQDWAGFLTAQDPEGGYMSLPAAIASVRKITVSAKQESDHTQGDFRAAKSVFEEVEAKNALGLPGFFIFRCIPYNGLAEAVITFRVSVLTGGDKPILVLRAVALEAVQEAIAEDFKQVLLAGLADVATLTIGTFKP